MQRIFCFFLCLALFGCGTNSPKEEVVRFDDLVLLEQRMDGIDGRIDAEGKARSNEILECKAGLKGQIDGVRAELATHRTDTAAALRKIEETCREEYKRELASRNGQVGGREVAYARQDSVPPPPRDDDVPQPRQEPGRYVVTSTAQGCVAIHDRQTGYHYQWRQDHAGWKLVLWQQSYCAGHRCVHPQWVYITPPSGFPTP